MPMPTETDVLRIQALRLRQRNKEVRDEGTPVVGGSVGSPAGADAGVGRTLSDPDILDESECGHAAGRTPSQLKEDGC